MNKISIKRFNPANIQPGKIILLIGKRGTGKSTLIKDLCFHMKDRYKIGIGMTPTTDSQEELAKFLPDTLIYNDFNTDDLKNIINVQQTDRSKKSDIRNILLICDDCGYDKKSLTDPAIRNIFMNGRHLKLGMVFAVQYLMDIQPALRTNVDYVFALRENIKANREKLYKYFFGCFDNYRQFEKVFEQTTQNNECIVLDNTNTSNDISKQIYYYKAKHDITPYKFGNPKYWLLDKRFQKSINDEPESINTAILSTNRHQSEIEARENITVLRDEDNE